MSQQWKAGTLVSTPPRSTGGWRGQMLSNRHDLLGKSAQDHDKFALASVGFGTVAVCGMAVVAAATSSFLLTPVVASVVLCSLFGAAAGGAFAGLGFKNFARLERADQSKLAHAVSSLNQGASIDRVIDDLGGEKIAAKLGGWRVSRSTTQTQPSERSPSPL